jgi:1-acyl-sn-glycerol-3-phosphate acyltransferase
MSREVVPDYSEAPRPDLYERSIERSTKLLNNLFGLAITGADNVPMEGGGIAVMSHRHYADPWVLGPSIPRAICGMAKNQLLRPYYFGLGRIYLANRGIFFVDRDNPSSESYNTSVETIEQGHLLGMAIEGTHKYRGPVLGEARNGVGRIALKATSENFSCTIIPVGMDTEDLHKRYRWHKPINVVIGEAIVVPPGSRNIRQRRNEAEELNQMVAENLQEVFSMAIDLRHSQ